MVPLVSRPIILFVTIAATAIAIVAAALVQFLAVFLAYLLHKISHVFSMLFMLVMNERRSFAQNFAGGELPLLCFPLILA